MKTDRKETTPEGVESGLHLLRKALENGWRFVLCVEAQNPRCAVSLTNAGERREAKMLAKFARRAKKRLEVGNSS